MSNLIREKQEYLIPVLDRSVFGVYKNKLSGAKHLVIKPIGLDIPAFAGQTAVVKTGSAGQKQVTTLTITDTWDGSPSKTYSIEVTKKAMYDGFTNNQFDISHTYSFTLPSFHTSTLGAVLDATDKAAIVTGLTAAITADKNLGGSAVNTGACVVPTGSTTLILTSKEFDSTFNVKTFNGEFSQVLTTPFKKATLTNDDVARIFSIKPDDAGRRVNVPSSGTAYACITITMLTKGYDNVVASGVNNVREQIVNIYTPAAQLATTPFPALTDVNTGTPSDVNFAADNVANMADTGGAANKTALEFIANVIDVYVNEVKQ